MVLSRAHQVSEIFVAMWRWTSLTLKSILDFHFGSSYRQHLLVIGKKVSLCIAWTNVINMCTLVYFCKISPETRTCAFFAHVNSPVGKLYFITLSHNWTNATMHQLNFLNTSNWFPNSKFVIPPANEVPSLALLWKTQATHDFFVKLTNLRKNIHLFEKRAKETCLTTKLIIRWRDKSIRRLIQVIIMGLRTLEVFCLSHAQPQC